jgi:hypothetical protein
VGFSVDPYLSRVYDPVRYDCWCLLREAWLELTGFDIGARPPAPAAALAIWRHFDRLPAAASPSIALMRRPRIVSHVGLFWRGRVLHIQPDGARYEMLESASLGFTEVGFYTHANRRSDR